MNYQNLEIWSLANQIAIDIHKMTLEDLPQFEMFETGSQIRRSSKSVKSNIAEGFGRRSSKKEFLLFLRYALASNDETQDHLHMLFTTRSLKNEEKFISLENTIVILGKKLTKFIKAVETHHQSGK